AMKEGTTTVKAANNGKELTCTVTVTATPPTPTDLPSVQGTAGKYTLAFQAPSIECAYKNICFFGAFEDNDPANPDAPVAEAIVQEGFTNWYKVVFEAEDGTAMGKICPETVDGARSWNTQAKTFEIVQGDAESVADMGANKISFGASALGDVVYVTVAEWSADPCTAPNPEGTATFNVIILTEFPDGFDPDDIEVSAAFWTPGSVEMSRDLAYQGPGYKFTGVYENYPANQQFKYNIKYKEGEWIWEKHDNRTMPYSLTTNDECVEWDSEPWNPIPGGNGTFKITLGAACGAADADKVIFTGNFTEEGWGDSQREMTPDNQGGWSWTGDFPENFMYKVILRTEGQDDKWVGPDGNWKFDGVTFEQEWSCE
ncbi:MAG: hypothetical protein II620_03585, partial [Paludibacteraceae bacterium]|nr:hypothetical protein [Paludibacteraceae bacterium]